MKVYQEDSERVMLSLSAVLSWHTRWWLKTEEAQGGLSLNAEQRGNCYLQWLIVDPALWRLCQVNMPLLRGQRGVRATSVPKIKALPTG